MRRRTLVLLFVLVICSIVPASAALWIDKVSDDGSVMQLSDDSVWQIEFADQVKASLWLPMTRVLIAKGSRTGAYRIVRERQGDSVRATLVR